MMKLVCIIFLLIPIKNFSQSLKPMQIENSTSEFGDLGLMYKNVWHFDRKKRVVINESFNKFEGELDTFQTIYYFNFLGRKTKIETFEIENSKVKLTSSNLIVNNQLKIDTSLTKVYEWGKLIVDTVIQIYKSDKNYKYYYLKSRKDSIVTIDILYSMNKDEVHYSKSYIKNDPTLSRCFTIEEWEKEKNRYINPDCPQGEVIEVYNKNKDIQQIDHFGDGELVYSERFVYDKQNRLIFKGQYYPTDTLIEAVEFIQKGDTLIEIRKEQNQFSIMKTVGLNQFYTKYSADSIPYQIGYMQFDKKKRLIRADYTGVDGHTPINFTNFLAGQTLTYSYPRKRFWCRELWK
jgi:hypothetical protein